MYPDNHDIELRLELFATKLGRDGEDHNAALLKEASTAIRRLKARLWPLLGRPAPKDPNAQEAETPT